MVLYRKYRPQKIADLDSIEVKDRLTRIFSSLYIPHALLFSGPRGTGKTSTARIVAKVLNCGKKAKAKVDIEPCNICESCISITEGRHLDILEIDAASNRGIEEIRELRDKIKLTPVSAKYKVYIIDEVHMLTNEAFNALLKTLEEPPRHAVFILCTTQLEKLPETIVSRCTKLNFHRATISEILNSLKRVALGEKIDADDKTLSLIAKYADGSFRDATKLLEQAITEHALTYDKVLSLFGRDSLSADKFLSIILDSKTDEALKLIEQSATRGADFRIFTAEILNLLHILLLHHYGINEKEIQGEEIYQKVDPLKINSLIKLFSRVYIELKNASISQLPLEVAIVEWCEKGGVV